MLFFVLVIKKDTFFSFSVSDSGFFFSVSKIIYMKFMFNVNHFFVFLLWFKFCNTTDIIQV